MQAGTKKIATPDSERSARTPDRVRTREYRRRRREEGREPLTLLIARESIAQLDALCEANGQQRHELVTALVAAAHADLMLGVAPGKDAAQGAKDHGKE